MTQQLHCISLSDTKASCIPQNSYDGLVTMSYWLWGVIIVCLLVITALPWVFKKTKGRL